MDQRAAVRKLLEGLFGRKGDNRGFSDADSLFLSGRLQSVDAVELVVFLEENWNIDFSKVGFDMALIDTVDAILDLRQYSQVSS
jgi:acyl carrier protein